MDVKQAADIIKNGGIVAFPTETVYGLGANALDREAVKKVFRAKGRPTDNPLIVHVASSQMLLNVVRSIPPQARGLIKRFWPGPLTIIFPASDEIPIETTGGLSTVAVRMPDNITALALITEAGVPIAAPSANKSGRPSPTSVEHVKEDFPDIPILSGKHSRHGMESTVIALDGKPRILRQGAISLKQLREVIPNITIAEQNPERPESPGMKYRHYAPDRPLILFSPEQLEHMKLYVKGKDVIILCKDRYAKEFTGQVIKLGSTDKEMAKSLYKALRTKREGEELVVLGTEKKGHGRTIMDRLERAATKSY
ncbi:threonylcarbamoyl-AMP synthase [Candidatus Woesearchaeota archaeon]|nr:threonylcarbamoyl-AMP synthase [Candidatus Woesearchaeota archaeon]